MHVSHLKINKLIYIFVILLFDLFIILLFPEFKTGYKVNYSFSSAIPGRLQVFYTGKDDALQWTEEKVTSVDYINVNSIENIEFKIPSDTENIRLDFYYQEDDTVISDLCLSYKGKDFPLEKDIISDLNNCNQITYVQYENNTYRIRANDIDPYIVYKFTDAMKSSLDKHDTVIHSLLKIAICILIDIVFVVLFNKFIMLMNFIRDLFKNRRLILSLSKNDFRTKYAGSYLGITWAFVQPIVTIIIYWIVFQYGLKASSPIQNVSFVLWFVSGLVPWFFFQEALINATNCMLEYSYLVKKVVFHVNILPVIKILSSFFVHLVFIVFVELIFIINGLFSGVYILQLFYYSFCCFILVLGLSYMTSSIVIFLKDLNQFIIIILQIFMWMTPIMWSDTILPASLKWFSFINPIFYIVDGFRDSLINKIWFWEKPMQTLYFWFIAMLAFLVGTAIFRKLKPHFADVL